MDAIDFAPLETLIQKYSGQFYQDVWSEGQRLAMGKRECLFRYQVMKEFFSRFQRPVKVLDIGANVGYFSMRLSEDFAGSFTLCESEPLELSMLWQLCRRQKASSIHILPKRLNLEDLVRWGQTEQFDVVLALSVLHHFNEPYQEVLQALTGLGTYLILEVPRKGEHLFRGDRVDAEPLDLSRLRAELLARPYYTVDNRNGRGILRDLYAIDCGQKWMGRTYPSAPQLQGAGLLTSCGFEKSEAYDIDARRMVPLPCGLSLSSFLNYNGVFPSPRALLAQVKEIDTRFLYSFNPWDLFLVEGQLLSYARPGAASDDPEQDKQRVLASFEKILAQQEGKGFLSEAAQALHERIT